jgi:hypothetical protein
MIDLRQLTDATVDTFRLIPEVIEILGDEQYIRAYVYQNPAQNELMTAVYQTPAGSILVAWIETVANDADDGWWLHRFHYILRGTTTGSSLDLLTALLNGVPVPGDGMRWRLCGLMPGLEPAKILEVSRQPDEEGIDYVQITAEIKETGDA